MLGMSYYYNLRLANSTVLWSLRKKKIIKSPLLFLVLLVLLDLKNKIKYKMICLLSSTH